MGNQQQSPDIHWEEMKRAMETGGASAVLEFVAGFPEGEWLQLLSFAQRAFGSREWNWGEPARRFDEYIPIARAAIAEALRRADVEEDPEQARKLKDTANMFGYNFSANLAECWPGDEHPREERHFQEGLRIAEQCIAWRDELEKPPSKKSMAWWAKGMHLLSLHRATESADAFRQSLQYSLDDEGGRDAPLSAELHSYAPLLSSGYLGLAERAGGNPAGENRYKQAITLLTAQEGIPEKKDDATFCLQQLGKAEQVVAKRYGV